VRARLRARVDTRRLAAGSGNDASARRFPDREVWMAHAVLGIRRARPGLGRRVVLVLPRYARAAPLGECGRAGPDSHGARRRPLAYHSLGSLAENPFERDGLEPVYHVLLLLVLSGGLSGLVPQVSERLPPLQPDA